MPITYSQGNFTYTATANAAAYSTVLPAPCVAGQTLLVAASSLAGPGVQVNFTDDVGNTYETKTNFVYVGLPGPFGQVTAVGLCLSCTGTPRTISAHFSLHGASTLTDGASVLCDVFSATPPLIAVDDYSIRVQGATPTSANGVISYPVNPEFTHDLVWALCLAGTGAGVNQGAASGFSAGTGYTQCQAGNFETGASAAGYISQFATPAGSASFQATFTNSVSGVTPVMAFAFHS